MTAVLVDTSVWRRYLSGRASRAETSAMGLLLDEDGCLFVHVAVIAELVLGGLRARDEELLQRLPRAAELPSDDVLSFIRARRLARRGVGWTDAQLLASALVAGVRLWSFDDGLARVARELGVAFTIAS